MSLDFFRGLTMFLLVVEFTGLYEYLVDPEAPAWLQVVGTQFHHHPWNGLRFWDLIQPFFMFIVGVAMPFSIGKRLERGDLRTDVTKHVLRRSFLLIFLGWWLYCIGPEKIVFKFQDVLAQIGVTYFIAYLLMDRPVKTQIIWSFLLIIASTLLYLYFPVEGFNQPYTPNKNFGSWFDLLYNGQDFEGYWTTFNAIPTSAHTIWGVLAGQLLKSNKTKVEKLKILVIIGIIGVVAGYASDPFIPIIKRISTASFVIVSGGWAFLALAFSLWLIDIKKWDKGVWIFAVVGMNPLFIYLFSHIGGANLTKDIVRPLTNSLSEWFGVWPMGTLASLLTVLMLWYICYWLYKKKIFIKI